MEKSKITGVYLRKLVTMDVYWDKGDFETEAEWEVFLNEVINDPDKADYWYDVGESDCSGDNGLPEKTYVELESQQAGRETQYQLLNPDVAAGSSGPIIVYP